MRSLRRLLTTLVLLLALPLQGWATAHGCVALQRHGAPAAATAPDAGHAHAAHHGSTAEAVHDHGTMPQAAGDPATADPADPAVDSALAACTQCASCCVAAVLAAAHDGLGLREAAPAPWATWAPTVAVRFITGGPERPPRNLLA